MLRKDSKLYIRNVEGSYELPRRLLGTLIQRLYLDEGADFVAEYRKQKYRFSDFYEECASGAVLPVDNKYQRQLRSMFPTQQQINVYIGAYDPTDASHYLSLRREGELFRLSHRKIRRGQTRRGVIGVWSPQATPMPDFASGVAPTLRLLGTGIHGFFHSLDWEARRELTHCAMLNSSNRLVTWHNPGRVTLQALPSSHDGYTQPFDFEVVSVRSTTIPNTKNKMLVHANVSPDVLSVPRAYSILPEFRDCTPYYFDTPGYNLAAEILRHRLTPIIGLPRDDYTTDFFTLSYDPDKARANIYCLMPNRSNRYSEHLPAIKPLTKHQWVPNFAFLHVLHGLINDPTPDPQMKAHRADQLDRLLIAFRAKDWPSYFEACGLID